jgi:hypothetical protein
MKSLPLISLVCFAFASVAAFGASNANPPREAVYRCKDEKGQSHFGDSMPQECFGRDTEVLSDRGTVLRVIEGEKARANRIEQEAVEKKETAARAARAQHDRMLIDTYLTVEDLERLRDQRVDMLVQQSRITEQNMSAIKERQARLVQQVARFKPYNNKPDAPPLPDHLAEEMLNTINGLTVYQQTLEQNRAEQTQLRASFASDISRFKELKGIK